MEVINEAWGIVNTADTVIRQRGCVITLNGMGDFNVLLDRELDDAEMVGKVSCLQAGATDSLSSVDDANKRIQTFNFVTGAPATGGFIFVIQRILAG